MKKETVGARHDLSDDYPVFESSGEYGKDENGIWHFVPPIDGFRGMGSLTKHSVIEHEDGTITVSPSIKTEDWQGHKWHGYLAKGVWREV